MERNCLKSKLLDSYNSSIYMNVVEDNKNQINTLHINYDGMFHEVPAKYGNNNFFQKKNYPKDAVNLSCLLEKKCHLTNICNMGIDKKFDSFFISRLKSIDEDTSQGVVYNVDYNNEKKNLIFKRPLNYDYDNLLETYFEFFVGIKVYNNLYKSCPNFMYTYDIALSKSYNLLRQFDNNKNDIFISKDEMCSLDSNSIIRNYIPYIITENINNGLRIYDMFNKVENGVLFLRSVLTQICFAFIVGSTKKLMHYDLHFDNFFIVDLETPHILNYTINDKKVMIVSRYLVKIIDYGSSVFEQNGIVYYSPMREEFFNPNIIHYNVNKISEHNTYLPCVDVFQILFYLMEELNAAIKDTNDPNEEKRYNIMRTYVYQIISIMEKRLKEIDPNFVMKINSVDFWRYKNECFTYEVLLETLYFINPSELFVKDNEINAYPHFKNLPSSNKIDPYNIDLKEFNDEMENSFKLFLFSIKRAISNQTMHVDVELENIISRYYNYIYEICNYKNKEFKDINQDIESFFLEAKMVIDIYGKIDAFTIKYIAKINESETINPKIKRIIISNLTYYLDLLREEKLKYIMNIKNKMNSTKKNYDSYMSDSVLLVLFN